jgi:hypothetical protein
LNAADVRYGSLADILTSPRHVRFTPNNGRWAAHQKSELAPMLVAIDGIGRSSPPSEVKFWAQAWKAAHQKARAIGWLDS